MTAGRPIGARVRTLCEILESAGPSEISDLRILMPDIERSNLWKYCRRGGEFGLISVSKVTGQSVFTVNPEWRAIAATHRTAKKKPPPKARVVVHKPRWAGINSVFQMGAM